MKLRNSTDMATRIARDDLKKRPAFKLAAIDVTGQGVGNGGDHLAAIMVWGENEQVASQRQREIVTAVNAHDALVELVAWMVEDNQINGSTCPSCGRDNSEYDRICTSDDCLGVKARAALKLAER